MTDTEKAIRWFENIAYECDKLTSGNVAHLRVQIKGMAIRSAEYLTKHSKEPASEDLEEATERYACKYSSSKYGYAKVGEAFKAGVQWDREQMMNDAVEGKMELNHIVVSYAELAKSFPTGKDGDKVRVIIIKE